MKTTLHIVSNIRRIITEAVNSAIVDNELQNLFNYLKQESTVDVMQMNGHTKLNQKAYNYFVPKAILHDVWIIHFTNLKGYEDIPQIGFNRGTNNIDNLAYSRGGENGGKFNFGFLLDNPYIDNYDLGYGDCALIFKTDGVLAYHKIDNDDEVIFINNNIKSNYYELLWDEAYDDVPSGWYYEGERYDSLREAINHIK